MKKTFKYLLVILFVFMMLIFVSCNDNEDDWKFDQKNAALEQAEQLHRDLLKCTGTNLTRDEMAQLVYDYEKVQKKWNGAKFFDPYDEKNNVVLDLQLVTPGKHEHDENTRYEITILEKDKLGFEKGLKVSVMNNSSTDETETDAESQEEETTLAETESGLPATEIEGAYTVSSVLTVRMKGKDEDEAWRDIESDEFTVTFNVTAVDDKTIRLDLNGVKFGEGPYDPATGICEFKIASEFDEAMKTAKPDDRTRQFTFSNDNEQIRFKGIIVGGGDDDSVMLGIKEG